VHRRTARGMSSAATHRRLSGRRSKATSWAVVISAILAACGSGGDVERSARGPVTFGSGHIDVCAPLTDAYRHMVFEQYLRFRGRGTATIDDVQTRAADGLVVVRYLVLSDPMGPSVGTVAYPPTSPSWNDARPANSAEVPRGRHLFLIAEARTSDPDGGRLAGSVIRYRVEGRHYRASTANTLTVSPDC
jgi:hypothetical protein